MAMVGGENEAPQQKVRFPIEEDRGIGTAEWMWADDLGNGRFRLDNVPLWVYGISYGDDFLAEMVDSPDTGDLVLGFKRVVKRNGDWTYRVPFYEGYAENEGAKVLIAKAKARAKLTSKFSPEYYMFSVVDENDRLAVEAALEEGKSKGYWDWEISSAPVDPT